MKAWVMHLKRSLLSYVLACKSYQEAFSMYFHFNLCTIVGILSSKYLHKWYPSFDFILNWWLKGTIYCVLHSLYKIQYCLSSFLYLIWYSILLLASYSINCCSSENKNHPKPNYLCANQLWSHSSCLHLCNLFWRWDLGFFKNSFLCFNPLHKLWLRLHLLWPCLLCDQFLSISRRPFYDTKTCTLILRTELYVLIPLLFSCATSYKLLVANTQQFQFAAYPDHCDLLFLILSDNWTEE